MMLCDALLPLRCSRPGALATSLINLLPSPIGCVLPRLPFAEEAARDRVTIEDFQRLSVCRFRADRHLALPWSSLTRRCCGRLIPMVSVVREALEIHPLLLLSEKIVA